MREGTPSARSHDKRRPRALTLPVSAGRGSRLPTWKTPAGRDASKRAARRQGAGRDDPKHARGGRGRAEQLDARGLHPRPQGRAHAHKVYGRGQQRPAARPPRAHAHAHRRRCPRLPPRARRGRRPPPAEIRAPARHHPGSPSVGARVARAEPPGPRAYLTNRKRAQRLTSLSNRPPAPPPRAPRGTTGA